MSASRPLKVQQTVRTAENDDFLDDAIPRLILAMNGDIVFANRMAETLAGGIALTGENFLKIAKFEDEGEAFRHSPLLFAQADLIFSALRSGLHYITFNSGEQMQLQFDSAVSHGGERYVIISAIEDDESFSRKVETLINPAAVSDAALPHFLDLSSDLLTISRGDGLFESINEKFTQLLGYTFHDLKDRTFTDLIHPDDRDQAQKLLHEFLSKGKTYLTIQCRVISNEARSHWIEWKMKKSGGRIYSVGRDLTALKKQEQDIQKREQQLSEAEAIGHMGHWHWVIGQQAIRFSDEIFRIFGMQPDQFTPTLDNVNAMLHRRDVGRLIQAFQRAIIEQNDHEIDFRIITPLGDTRHIRCQGRCEFDSEGDVIGLYGIMQDVTQAVMHERALMESKETTERAYAAKSQFLANMSHELRTPLNAIIGFSEMMQQQLLGPIGNDRYLDYIKGIRESGEHLLDLITDILDMSKIEAGKYKLDIEDINLTKVIRLAVHMVEGRAMDTGIKLHVTLPDDFHIVADRRGVMQIMLNLLSNAVKFSHPNSKVEVECVPHEAHVSIRVKDHGIGIPANKLPTITNPFEQAANQYTRSHEGSGLGLSITKELAELHGGSIHIESAVNVGTTVTIRLPFDAAHARRDVDRDKPE